jgi:hypothetical protein
LIHTDFKHLLEEVAMKWKLYLYWVLKVLFAAGMLNSAYMKLSLNEGLVKGMQFLGYPQYLLYILGTAYVLGVIGIFQPFYATLREWAYAGFCFALLGACLSHWSSGQAFLSATPAMVLLVVMFVAYFLEKSHTKNI